MAFQQLLGCLRFGLLLLRLFVEIDGLKLRKQEVVHIFSCQMRILYGFNNFIQSLHLCLKLTFLSIFLSEPLFQLPNLPMQAHNLIFLLTKHSSVIQKPSAIRIFAGKINLPLEQSVDLVLK